VEGELRLFFFIAILVVFCELGVTDRSVEFSFKTKQKSWLPAIKAPSVIAFINFGTEETVFEKVVRKLA